MNRLRRLNHGLARGEAALTATVLIVMILVAAAQSLLRNLTDLHITWANTILAQMDWADSFLQKGTLWLAFLGASLSTYDEKHIAIDVAQRFARFRTKKALLSVVSAFAGVTCFYLARVFWMAVKNNAAELPLHLSVLGDLDSMVHACDATVAQLEVARMVRPSTFCAFRDICDAIGAKVPTPDVALQLIVPAMFLFMAVRFFARCVACGIESYTGRGLWADEQSTAVSTGAGN